MGGGEAEGGKVDAGGKGQEAVVGADKVAGGVVAGGNGRCLRAAVAHPQSPGSNPGHFPPATSFGSSGKSMAPKV